MTEPEDSKPDLDPRTVRLIAAVSELVRKDPRDAFGRGWNKALDDVIALLEHDGVSAAEEIGQLTREALDKRRAEGKKLGGEVPYGFRLGRDGETLVRLPSEQQVISAVRMMRARGMSLRKIAAELATRGVRTRKRGKFMPTQILRMLKVADANEPESVAS